MSKEAIILIEIFLSFISCSSGSEQVDIDSPKVVSTMPQNGSVEVAINSAIKITFDEEIKVTNPQNITINGRSIVVEINRNILTISVSLSPGNSYIVNIGQPAITDLSGNIVSPFTLSFSTALGKSGFDEQGFDLKSSLCVSNPTKEAVNVYSFLKNNVGKKVISGVMANVSWNLNEAEWIHKRTNKWPALHGFDYIHLAWEPSGWNNYTDTHLVEEWWNANGLVSCMWHWNVPIHQIDNRPQDMSFYTSGNEFDISKALLEGSFEKKTIDADLAKIVTYLKLLHAKNIPILWRPLHEASGGWFWWGGKGAAPFKALWKYMFEYFQREGLNNLIWVYTMGVDEDSSWYPGNEYVDIIGVDYYPTANIHSSLIEQFNKIKKRTGGNKIITLSECGGIPDPSEMYSKGDMWSWFMPWYGNYTESEDQNGNYWETVLNSPYVITRERMPDLK